MFLTGRAIAELVVQNHKPSAIQPAGVDLSVGAIELIRAPGLLGEDSRVVPAGETLEPGPDGFYTLAPGAYRVRFAERVSIPRWGVGFCLPRSSLLRMGAYLACAVWDPGYRGIGASLLVVHNPHGLRLERGARVAQLVVARLESLPHSTYTGLYQGEGLGSD